VVFYATGDATMPQSDGNKVIVHVCNDVGAWGAGFVLAISRRWKQPELDYRRWATVGDSSFALGGVQLVQVEEDIWVANLIGQRGIRGRAGIPPIRYEAVALGLATVADFARDLKASIHMPRIGAGLAGGDWTRIEALIDQELADETVTVYDLPKVAALDQTSV
jgi:O-acetyl-ADP-ribose deacetylase (regulator of RNase III)